MLAVLHIKVISAKNLIPRTDGNEGNARQPNAFCNLQLGEEREPVRTATKNKTSNPKWNEPFHFELIGGYDHPRLELTIWDKDPWKKTVKLIGSVVLDVDDILRENIELKCPQSFPLLPHSHELALHSSLGSLEVEFNVERTEISDLVTLLRRDKESSEKINFYLHSLSKMCSNKCTDAKHNRDKLLGENFVPIILKFLENRKTERNASYVAKNTSLAPLFLPQFVSFGGFEKLERCLHSKNATLIKNSVQTLFNMTVTRREDMVALLSKGSKGSECLESVLNLLNPKNRNNQIHLVDLQKSGEEIYENILIQLSRLIGLLTSSSLELKETMGNLGVINWLVHLLKIEGSTSNDSLRCAAADALNFLAEDSNQNQGKILEDLKDSPLLNMMDRSNSERLSALLLKLISIIIYKRGKDPLLAAYFMELEKPLRLQKLIESCISSSREIRIAALEVVANFCQSCEFRPEVDLANFVIVPLSSLLNSDDDTILLLGLRIISYCIKRTGVYIVLQEGELLAKQFQPTKSRLSRKSIQATWSQKPDDNRKGVHNLFSESNPSLPSIQNTRGRSMSNANSSQIFSKVTESNTPQASSNVTLGKSSSQNKIEGTKLTKMVDNRHLGTLPFRPFIRLISSKTSKIVSRCLQILIILVQRDASVNGNVQPASDLLIENGFLELLLSKLQSNNPKELVSSINLLQCLSKNEMSINHFKQIESFNVVMEIVKILEKKFDSKEIIKYSCSFLLSLVSSEELFKIFQESNGVKLICETVSSIPLPGKTVLAPLNNSQTTDTIGLDEALSLIEVFSLKTENSAKILRGYDAIKTISNILICRTDILSSTKARGEKILSSLGDGLEPRHRIAFEIFTTEYFFVKFLRLVKLIFVDPLAKSSIVSLSDMEKIFSPLDIEVLIDFHTNLLFDFQLKIVNWTPMIQFSDSFIRSYPFLRIYKEYCISFENLHNNLKELRSKNEKFKKFLKNQINRHKLELNSLDLESVLVMPVQRPPRYTLLFKELLKKTPEDHPDYLNTKEAIQGSEDVNQYINSNIHISKTEQKIRELETKLKLPLFLPHRVFVKEGALIRFLKNGGMDHKIYYFLFNDIILLMKRTKIRKFAHEDEVIFSLIDKLSMEEIDLVDNVNVTSISSHYKPGIIRSKFTNQFLIVSSRTATSVEKEELFLEIKKLSGQKSQQRGRSNSLSSVNTSANNEWFHEIVQAQNVTKTIEDSNEDLMVFEE